MKIIQYDANGNMIKKYNDVKAAAKASNVSCTSIYRAIDNSNYTCNNCRWKAEYDYYEQICNNLKQFNKGTLNKYDKQLLEIGLKILSEDDYNLINTRLIHGGKLKYTAAVMGCSEYTVTKRVKRIVKKLGDFIDPMKEL